MRKSRITDSYHKPEELPAAPAAGQRHLARRKGCLTALALLLLVGCLAIATILRILAFGSAISTQAPLTTQTSYMGGTDRVNLLVLGYGGGSQDSDNLTDSMMVMSLMPQNHHTTLISVPRDLWVELPPGSRQYQKIDVAYEFGSNNGADPAAGGNAALQQVSLITGLHITYWMTINFQGFRDFINAIGGINVFVPDSFTSLYPKNDDPSVNANWITIHFQRGMQHMDGETAIRYARAREVTDNQAEVGDFARSARQQIIVRAALAKVKQVTTWPSLFNALVALQHAIYTNLSLADLFEFTLKMDLNTARHIGLSDQNVLVDALSPDGQYILLPADNNWQSIVAYVKQQLYN